SDLRRALGATLPPYMVPSVIVALDAFPLTPNGKIDRNALPAAQAPGERTYVAPRTSEEVVLAEVWAEALSVEQVSVHDNFFDLGGHSLLATQVVALTRERAGAEIPVRAIFEAPTVAELAVVVAGAGGRPTLPPLVAVDRARFRR
ncbi:MAG TPA: phosphopantetheine-binding protein, partial [Acidimicrobiales bacterium]|nr:phosphopantetheine-binding protein [Acidimicrobiales bacterium]